MLWVKIPETGQWSWAHAGTQPMNYPNLKHFASYPPLDNPSNPNQSSSTNPQLTDNKNPKKISVEKEIYPGSLTQEKPVCIGWNWYQYAKSTEKTVWVKYKDEKQEFIFRVPQIKDSFYRGGRPEIDPGPFGGGGLCEANTKRYMEARKDAKNIQPEDRETYCPPEC